MQNLKSKYEQQEMKVSDGLWDRLEAKLDQVPVKEKKPKVMWWRFVAVIILIVSFNGVSWMTDIENKVKNYQVLKFPSRVENQILTAKEQAFYDQQFKTPTPKKNNIDKNPNLKIENLKIAENLRTENHKNNIQTSEKELSIKKEEPPIVTKPEEQLAQFGIQKPKEKVKYVSSSDLLFGVEIDKAKSETPKSAMGINTPKIKSESDFPNPKRIKLFGITLYDKDSITTK